MFEKWKQKLWTSNISIIISSSINGIIGSIIVGIIIRIISGISIISITIGLVCI